MRLGGANNPSPYGGITRIKSSVEARRSLSAFRLPFGCALIFPHPPDNPARAVLGKKVAIVCWKRHWAAVPSRTKS